MSYFDEPLIIHIRISAISMTTRSVEYSLGTIERCTMMDKYATFGLVSALFFYDTYYTMLDARVVAAAPVIKIM